MSDNSGNGGFVLRCVSGCYAEVHISYLNMLTGLKVTLSLINLSKLNIYCIFVIFLLYQTGACLLSVLFCQE